MASRESYFQESQSYNNDYTKTTSSDSESIDKSNKFANDGSFMEMFKKMQQSANSSAAVDKDRSESSPTSSAVTAQTSSQKVDATKPRPPPFVSVCIIHLDYCRQIDNYGIN